MSDSSSLFLFFSVCRRQAANRAARQKRAILNSFFYCDDKFGVYLISASGLPGLKEGQC
jgi:hypothetical protein